MGHYGGSYKVSLGLHKKYGDLRVLDTPICGASAEAMEDDRMVQRARNQRHSSFFFQRQRRART